MTQINQPQMDQVILKCSDTVQKTSQRLWLDKDFTDVTLATCDGNQIKAHKVILCSASKFFRDVLAGKCSENLSIYFKGVFFQELELVIKFIYLGECQVAEDHLDKFLDLAFELQVEGVLKEDTNGKSENLEHGERNKDLKKGQMKKLEEGDDVLDSALVQSMLHQSISIGSNDDLQSVFETESKENGNGSSSDSVSKKKAFEVLERFSCNLCKKGFYYIYQLNEHKKVKHEGKGYACDLCGKSFSKENVLIKHKEVKHEGLRYECDDCDFISVSRRNLKSHKDYIHAGIGVDCDVCENKYSTKWALISHKLKVHGISK